MPEFQTSSVANCYVDSRVSMVPDPLIFQNDNAVQRELEYQLINAFKRACSTTTVGQTFYRTEFDRAVNALTNMGCIDDAHTDREDPEQIFSRLTRLLDELQQVGNKGLSFRLWRDGISLVSSVILLSTVASTLLSKESQGDGDFSAANHPFGNLAGDIGMVALEGSKMLITTSLSYPTLKRHHLTDEFVKRITTSVELLQACLDDHSAGESAHNRLPSHPIRRRALQCMEKGRDISTVFTLLNTTLSTVRAMLWSIETLGNDASFASWRGLLRLVQNVSDSTRALFSSAGTFARNTLFSSDLERCKSAVPAMRSQLFHANSASLKSKLEKIAILCSVCSTPLLCRIAKSEQLFKSYQEAEINSEQDVQDFLRKAGIAFTVAHDGRFLHDKPPENQWGQRLVGGTYTCAPAQLVRVPYRLALWAQYQLGRLAELPFRH